MSAAGSARRLPMGRPIDLSVPPENDVPADPAFRKVRLDCRTPADAAARPPERGAAYSGSLDGL